MKLGRAKWAIVGGVAATIGGLSWSALHREAPPTTAALPPVSSQNGTEPQAETSHVEPTAPAKYVGTNACIDCHQNEYDDYRGSDHQHAIELPSPQSVLAPFAGEAFRHDGISTSFIKKGEDYFVRTPGRDGKPGEFRVAYTFGHFPLQQYLLDMGGGRLQSFVVAWDSRPKDQGGQRYFDLYPDEDFAPEHELHWTRPSQNWNYTCADCHTTALRKGYDPTHDTFTPEWAVLNVGCEACHGPGSEHLVWAKAHKEGQQQPGYGFTVALQRNDSWLAPQAHAARTATPQPGPANDTEINACAPCHSRRAQLKESHLPSDPFFSSYEPELLRDELYYADGQIRDEVYVYGSFLQSKMYQSGVRCSDCHNPHSLKLRRTGNDLCNGCHNAEVYDTQKHHHHEAEGSACVDCHMPTTTYMGVDPRRDHSMRVPRPDMAVFTGAPDACTGCHDKQSPAWAARQIETWFGQDRPAHYGKLFAAARSSDPEAVEDLGHLVRDPSVPSIVRATALLLFANYPQQAMPALSYGAQSQDAFLRLGAAHGARTLPADVRLDLVIPLTKDALLAVRTEATRALVDIPAQAIPSKHRAAVHEALEALKATEAYNLDRPDAQLRLALIAISQGQTETAVRYLERALELDASFVPALVNLADLVRRADAPSGADEQRAHSLLWRAVETDPQNAEAWHALGLSFVRQKKLDEALRHLQKAVTLRPENPRFFYVYAVAQAEAGSIARAIATLDAGLERHPRNVQLLQALLNYASQTGDQGLARSAAERLAELGALRR